MYYSGALGKVAFSRVCTLLRGCTLRSDQEGKLLLLLLLVPLVGDFRSSQSIEQVGLVWHSFGVLQGVLHASPLRVTIFYPAVVREKKKATYCVRSK